MGRFRVPPGAISRPHYHENCESAVYMLSGSMRIRWGDRLEQELLVEPGDLLYVPPRETHVLENPSATEPADYVVGRDSPLEDAVIVPWAQDEP
ncbi:MAG: cupin domain-containing protein [Solirubrobacteraceae bacterium]